MWPRAIGRGGLWVVVLLGACSDADPLPGFKGDLGNEGFDVRGLLEAAGGFDTLLSAMDLTGQSGLLEGETPITLFAPTDEALALLGPGFPTELSNAALTTILEDHLIIGELVPFADIVAAGGVVTASGRTHTPGESFGLPVMNEILPLGQVDLLATNGLVHVLQAPLVQTTPFAGNLVEVLEVSPWLVTLGEAVTYAGLDTLLADDNGGAGYTLLAPSEDALLGLGVVLSCADADCTPTPPAVVEEILLRHIVAEALDAATLDAGGSFVTIAGSTVTLTPSLDAGGEAVLLLDSDETEEDEALLVDTTAVETTSGTLHLMGGVLAPPAQ